MHKALWEYLYLGSSEVYTPQSFIIKNNCYWEGRQQKQEELQFCSLWKENHIHRKIDKMKRQRTLYQMKEKDKTPEKQLNEVEIGNIPEKNSE